MEDTEQRRG